VKKLPHKPGNELNQCNHPEFEVIGSISGSESQSYRPTLRPVLLQQVLEKNQFEASLQSGLNSQDSVLDRRSQPELEVDDRTQGSQFEFSRRSSFSSALQNVLIP
jgi:hypothetical protein